MTDASPANLSGQRSRKDYFFLLINLLIILGILAAMGSGIAVGILLIPAIGSSFALAFLPHSLVTIIAFLPLMACAALVLQFLKHSWLALQDYRDKNDQKVFVYLGRLFAQLFMLRAWAFFAKNCDKDYGDGNVWSAGGFCYLILSILTSIICGIYLSAVILPTLVLAIIAITGLPQAVVGLVAALVAISLIWTTHEFLMLLPRLIDLVFQMKWWRSKEQYKDPLFHFLQSLLTLTGLAGTGYICYLIFPLIVNSLLPFLPQATAVFTALLVSVGLMVLTMHTLALVTGFLGESLRMLADKFENGPSGLTQAFKKQEAGLRRLLGAELDEKDIDEELNQEYPPIRSDSLKEWADSGAHSSILGGGSQNRRLSAISPAPTS